MQIYVMWKVKTAVDKDNNTKGMDMADNDWERKGTQNRNSKTLSHSITMKTKLIVYPCKYWSKKQRERRWIFREIFLAQFR